MKAKSIPASALKPPRLQVLVLLHGDGTVEVFGGKHVDAHIQVVPYMETPEGERLAEDVVELQLPQRFRRLFYPAMRRAVGVLRKLHPSTIVASMQAADAIRALNELPSPETEKVTSTLLDAERRRQT